jgi:hypothetical protein
MAKHEDINAMSWPQLNDALLECEDVAKLSRWLKATVATGVRYRALRVHGRMNAVRRDQELRAIHAACTPTPIKPTEEEAA